MSPRLPSYRPSGRVGTTTGPAPPSRPSPTLDPANVNCENHGRTVSARSVKDDFAMRRLVEAASASRGEGAAFGIASHQPPPPSVSSASAYVTPEPPHQRRRGGPSPPLVPRQSPGSSQVCLLSSEKHLSFGAAWLSEHLIELSG